MGGDRATSIVDRRAINSRIGQLGGLVGDAKRDRHSSLASGPAHRSRLPRQDWLLPTRRDASMGVSAFLHHHYGEALNLFREPHLLLLG
jgi:hypothetical protein